MNPLVPADVDLRGMQFMPLDVARLRDSQLAIKATGDEFRAAVLLWCASWVQIPASSLPNDDADLAYLSGYGKDVSSWLTVKDGAMRGFVLCDDGRWYHPVVAEKAMEAWVGRSDHREKEDNEAERKRRERAWRKAAFAALREVSIVPRFDERTAALREMISENGLSERVTCLIGVTGHVTDVVTGVTRTSHGLVTAKTGTGTGTGTEKDKDQKTSSSRRSSSSDGDDMPGFAEFWDAYPRKVAKQAAAKAWAKLKPKDDLVGVIVAAVKARAATPDWQGDPKYIPHPASYLNGKRWLDGTPATPSGVIDNPLADLISGAI